MAIYKHAKQKFQIVDFSLSHNQLLLRSFKSRDRAYNIDIIFKGVSRSILSTEMNGFEISVLKDEEAIHFLKERFYFDTDYDYRIFLIKDDGGKAYYINAFCFGVYHNSLDILETSIGRYDSENFGELQEWYAD
jgi:hypothetical protein